MILIRCGALIDGTGADAAHSCSILVDGADIKSVLSSSETDDGLASDIIDLSRYTVMPGLIDCHDHLTIDPGDEEAQMREPVAYLAMKAARNARSLLRAGITTLRGAGEKHNIDLDVRRAISEGLIRGPRVLACGEPLVRASSSQTSIGQGVSGAQAARDAVARQAALGVDHIKMFVSGSFASKGSSPTMQELADDEIEHAAAAARERGLGVMTHIHGGSGVSAALRAGVYSVEHGILCTEAEVRDIAAAGCWLVFTAGVFTAATTDPAIPDHMKSKLGSALENSLSVQRWARQYGAKVAVGTDTNHTRLDMEAQALVDAGWSPMQAMQACTLWGARLCGLGDKTGSIEPGKWADIIAVEGDPLTDAGALRDIRFVMKAGVVEMKPG